MAGPAWARRFDIADIVRAHRAELEASQWVNARQRRVLTDIAQCRTEALGGHLEQCTECDHEKRVYNSCRNRHCPKCQALAQEKWIDQQRQRMLDLKHFHVVFTLPSELRPLAAFAPRVVYDAMFRVVTRMSQLESIAARLGNEAAYYIEHRCTTVPKERLRLPAPDSVERDFGASNRSPQVLRSLQAMLSAGRLGHTGYVSVLPVDQGIEHSAGASFAKNPDYFDPENIVKLAIEGGCSAVASTFGVLGSVARKYAHGIPFVVKFNHNELLSYPNKSEQITFGTIKQAWDMGATAVGATVYFGSDDATREIVEVSTLFQAAHELGMATILWCYLRNPAFVVGNTDHHLSADLTGQANHLGVTLGADIIKQKLPENNGGYQALNQGDSSYGKLDERIYSELSSLHPIDLCRYQVLNCYAGRVGLINSGGASGEDDFRDAVTTAIVNKRAGGMGLISGRKAFQRPMAEGVELLHAIQDVYLCQDITVA